MTITASMLYNATKCPTRPLLDQFENPALRDTVSPFVNLLWERGALHEERVVLEMVPKPLNLLDAAWTHEEREQRTHKAMRESVPLIYGGRITTDDLVGEPDLLRWVDGGYIPVDIKSGNAFESGNDGKPKLHYAVQLALYVDILEGLGVSAGRRGEIIDINSSTESYDLTAQKGIRDQTTWWDEYISLRDEVRAQVQGQLVPPPALCADCKLCVWQTRCKAALEASDDLSLIAMLGRAKRDALQVAFPSVRALATGAIESHLLKGNKTSFPGIGGGTLIDFKARARLLHERGAPYLKSPVDFPIVAREIYFDIEADPFRDIVYLHGFVEVDVATGQERFVAFYADEPNRTSEEARFAEAMAYLRTTGDSTVFHFSAYERTAYKKLAARYPLVAPIDEVEALFGRGSTIDLLMIVRDQTEWPTYDRSIKTLATHLKFKWRDSNPSGAASIEWYEQWVATQDPAIKQRILDYNEDDCRAMAVLRRALPELRLES